MKIYREFLQKATPFKSKNIDVTGWFYSEAGNGVRCFWDGGVSRDVLVTTVPWANTTYPNTGLVRKGLPARSTGLWSSDGLPLLMPDAFLNQLPRMALDGEILLPDLTEIGLRNFSRGEHRVRDEDSFSYAVDTAPPLGHVFRTGEIYSDTFMKRIDHKLISNWFSLLKDSPLDEYSFVPESTTFDARLYITADAVGAGGSDVHLRQHTKLPDDRYETAKVLGKLTHVDNRSDDSVLVLTEPSSVWVPKFVSSLLFFDFRGKNA